MSKFIRRFALATMLVGSAMDLPAVATAGNLAPLQPGLDYHSFANVEQFRVTRLELDLRVDFTQKVLRGVVGLQIKRLDPSATELILDTRDLSVADVTQKAQDVLGAMTKTETTWVSRPFHFEKKDPILGQALVIELRPSKKPSEFIRIEYETSPSSPALQWLTAKQTKHRPFLYTVSSPIGARSWIPLQDTPSVRMTYKAIVHTDSDVLAVMGAKSDAHDTGRPVKRNGEYAFVMADAIPSYLIALAVGDLKFQETGPRTGVYADKSMLKEAAKEFAGAESLIEDGERLAGPYRWERFDMVVMPPSFPAAAIGNPHNVFITPTVIAADMGLMPTVAHALAQQWAGDLIGNATWRDQWISAGMTAYLQSRFIEKLYGPERDSMDRVLAFASLKEDLATLAPADQALAPDLRDRDPTEVPSRIPDQKGLLFFDYLDSKFGRERFDAFMRAYFDHFELKSVTTEQFVQYLDDSLLSRFPGVVSRNEVSEWIFGPGIPGDAVLPTTEAFASVDLERTAWLSGKVPAKKLATRAWSAPQWRYFLENMPQPLATTQMNELDQAYGLSQSADGEVCRDWLLLVVRNRHQPGNVRLEDFLLHIGRNSLIIPLYREMMRTPAGAVQAKRVYKLAREGYHPRTVALVDPIVNPASDTAEGPDE